MVRVPPFDPGASVEGAHSTTFFSHAGACELARRIRDAWREAGHDVLVFVEPLIAPRAVNKEFVVRSDLIGGLPRYAVKAAAPKHLESGGYKPRRPTTEEMAE